MTNPLLWRVGPAGVYAGDLLIRACSADDAAATVAAHNRFVAEPAPSTPDLDDPSDEHDRICRERDEDAAEGEWFR